MSSSVSLSPSLLHHLLQGSKLQHMLEPLLRPFSSRGSVSGMSQEEQEDDNGSSSSFAFEQGPPKASRSLSGEKLPVPLEAAAAVMTKGDSLEEKEEEETHAASDEEGEEESKAARASSKSAAGKGSKGKGCQRQEGQGPS